MRATQVPPANVFLTVCLLADAEELSTELLVGTLSSVEEWREPSDLLLESESATGNDTSELGSDKEGSRKASLLRMLSIQRDGLANIQ